MLKSILPMILFFMAVGCHYHEDILTQVRVNPTTITFKSVRFSYLSETNSNGYTWDNIQEGVEPDMKLTFYDSYGSLLFTSPVINNAKIDSVYAFDFMPDIVLDSFAYENMQWYLEDIENGNPLGDSNIAAGEFPFPSIYPKDSIVSSNAFMRVVFDFEYGF
jgi:hypothetical protein